MFSNLIRFIMLRKSNSSDIYFLAFKYFRYRSNLFEIHADLQHFEHCQQVKKLIKCIDINSLKS